jgi:hypothetical protein
MEKEEIHILPTHNTPEVIFSPNGIIKIKGRALSINKTEFPEQIMNGFEAYLSNPPDTTDVIIAFEYLNSFNAKTFVSILKKLSQAILQPKKLAIRWYYEEDDEDMLELGKYISEIYAISMEFIMTNDITSL